MIGTALLIMVLFRLMSGSIEIFAAMLMFKMNDIEKALIINSSLALIGPTILVITTTVGLLGMSEKLSLFKIFCVFGGVALILIGIKSK
ncbi:YqhV family protein [Sediminibacillus massiliensis]|uniref:YqhV family protein n=1 Tax=Sediminibacillus massiliensis TaxID=1926277 RepID=UPI00098864F5|nr:YqhV family protein [Sediminibacillus massiliensis]